MVFENYLNIQAYGRAHVIYEEERKSTREHKMVSSFDPKTSFNYYDKLQAKRYLANTTSRTTTVYTHFNISLVFIDLSPTMKNKLENGWTSDQNMKGSVY